MSGHEAWASAVVFIALLVFSGFIAWLMLRAEK